MRNYRNALLVNSDQNSTYHDRKLGLDTTGQAKLNSASGDHLRGDCGDHPHAVTALDRAPKAVILQVVNRRRDYFPNG